MNRRGGGLPAPLGRFRLFTLRHLSSHRLRSAICLGAVALSVALVTGLFATYGSLTESVHRFAHDLAGNAGLEVSGLTDAGFDEDLADRVAADRDVAAVVPMVRTTVRVDGRRVVLLGVDRRVTALHSTLLDTVDRLPSQVRLSILSVARGEHNELVAGPALRATPGDDVAVGNPAGGRFRVTVFSRVDEPQADSLNHGYWAIANLRTAQRVGGRPGRVDSALVVARPGADLTALQRRLLAAVDGRAVVAPPDFRAAQAADASSLLRNMTLFVGGIALAGAALLVFTTVTMAAFERMPELATLRAVGGRRGVVVRGFLVEAGLLGAAGCVLGGALGLAFGRLTVASLPEFLTETFEARVVFAVPGYVLPLACGAGLAATLFGAWAAVHRLVNVDPAQALHPARAAADDGGDGSAGRPAVPVAVGVLAVAGAVAVLVGADGQGTLAAGPLVLVGALALSYAARPAVAAAASAVAGRFGGTGRLATFGVGRVPARVWATVATIAATLGIGVATQATVADAVRAASAPSLARTDFYLKATPPSVLPTGPILPAGLAERVASVPGVAEVDSGQAAYANVGAQRVLLAGVTGGNAPAFRAAGERARRTVLDGTGVVVSRGLARALGLRAGGTLELPTALGPRTVPVAQVVDYLSLDGGIVVLSLPRMQEWFGRGGATWLEVQLAPGADARAVRAALTSVAAGFPGDVRVNSGEEERRGGQDAARQAGAVALAIQWMIAVTAGLTMLNTLLLSVVERRRELAVLRALGATRRRVRRVVAVEAAALAVLGCAAGVVLAVPLQFCLAEGLSRAAAVSVGVHPVAPSLPLVLAVFLVAVLVPVLPAARQAARSDPALALQDD